MAKEAFQTPEEFELWYAANSKLSVSYLREHGRVVAPCQCGEEGCEGWQSISREIMDDYKAMGRIPHDWDWPPK